MEENNNDEFNEVIKTLKQIETEENENANETEYVEDKQKKSDKKIEKRDFKQWAKDNRFYIEFAIAVFIFLLPCFIAGIDDLDDIILCIEVYLPIISFSISLILFHKNKSISVLIGMLGWAIYGWILLSGYTATTDGGSGIPSGKSFYMLYAILATAAEAAIIVGMLIIFAISAKISKKWKYSEIVIFFLAELTVWLAFLEDLIINL